MKFTKQQAYENIVAQLTSNGETLSLSERSINEQLETLIQNGANEETELDAFVTTWLPMFKTTNANINHDVSEGINQYKKDNPLPTPKKDDKKGDKKNDDKSDLEKRLEDMERRLLESEQKEKFSAIKRQVVSKLKEKGVDNVEWANALMDGVTITDDFDVDKKVETYVSLYNKAIAANGGNVTPGAAGGASANKNIDDCIKRASEIAKSQSLA